MSFARACYHPYRPLPVVSAGRAVLPAGVAAAAAIGQGIAFAGVMWLLLAAPALLG